VPSVDVPHMLLGLPSRPAFSFDDAQTLVACGGVGGNPAGQRVDVVPGTSFLVLVARSIALLFIRGRPREDLRLVTRCLARWSLRTIFIDGTTSGAGNDA
jgi:hypothetical protein